MLPPLVSVAALAAWVGEDFIDDENARAAAVVAAASALVRAETGRTWVDEDNVLLGVPEEVATVAVQIAARVWRNPAGFVQDTTGPFTVRYSERSGDGLFLTETERSILSRYRTQRRGLWTQRVTRDDPFLDAAAVDAVFVPTRYGDAGPFGEPVPWGTTDEIGPA